MSNTIKLRGFATLNFYAADHEGAKKWYTELFGFPPYYDMPGYFEFRLGDFEAEFGVIDAQYAAPGTNEKPGGAIMHWAVDDLEGTLEKLLKMGATLFEPITKRGEGFETASVVDPFGNIFGIMKNVHYLEIARKHGK
jgi:predicted enzyme related to lactoylglutathione lyase